MRTITTLVVLSLIFAEAGGDVFIVASVAPTEMQAEAYLCSIDAELPVVREVQG